MGTCFTSRNVKVQQKSPASTAIEYLMLTFNTHIYWMWKAAFEVRPYKTELVL